MNLIKLPQDIFNLDYNKIKILDGWGEQSVNNLKYSIDERRNISLERFIYSLGIRHIGLENAKLISKQLKSSTNFILLYKNRNFDDLLNIDGIGEAQISSIKNFFLNKTNIKVISELDKIIKIKDVVQIKKGGPFANKTFMLTGKLENISRAEAKSMIEKNSGSVVSNVSKKLDYLIIGEKPTVRKINQAKELKIKVLSQNEWLNMLNKRG